MANGIRTSDPCGFNKGRISKFHEGSRVRPTPEEGRRTYRPKRCGNNNKDEDNNPKTLIDKKRIILFTFSHLFALSEVIKILQLNTNSSVQLYSFVYSPVNRPKYCYVSLTVRLNISHLFTHS